MAVKSPSIRVDPVLIRWARESLGLPLERAAKRVGVKKDKLEHWERVEAHPTARQLEKLADVYKRPLATFFLPAPPADPPLPVDFRSLPSKTAPPLSAATLLAIHRARRLQRIYTDLLLDSAEHIAPPLLPTLLEHEDPEPRASEMRIVLDIPLQAQFSWGSPAEGLKAWRRAIEGRGILVFQFSMPLKETRGFSLSNGAPIIALNTRDAQAARIFTLFHECAHLLLKKPGICNPEDDIRISPGDEVEIFCNAFAGSFLVPTNSLLEHPSISACRGKQLPLDEAIADAAMSFSVSKHVILRRLLISNAISTADYRRTLDQWEAFQLERQPPMKTKGGPSPSVRTVSELGTTFVSTVLRARERGRITDGDVTDYLSVRLKHLQKVQALVSAE